MKVYLMLSADKTEFKEACKRFKVKFNKMPVYVKSNPMFALKSKKKAIEQCRHQNNYKAETELEFLLTYDLIYYFKEIFIY